ncbi:MAG: TetR family transcriptional regulator [Lachnospiraceae bacterium]|jgi:AcrR family transcriptional regulator|nr:TetR family transcriptional regulator [Oscillospiraceae bacterium]MCI8996299.1 TetR family transcriptional regulator [Lachnospiraceae bacterium]
MANFTKKAILQVFEEMLNQMPFEKITVSALVVKCGISSNTFYYHYRDIYDLLDAWMLMKREQLRKETEGLKGWPASLKVELHYVQEHPKLVYHILDSISRERLERFIFGSVEHLFYEDVKTHADGTEVPDEVLRAIASFCCYSFLGFLLKFIWGQMEADVDASVDGLSFIFAGIIESVIEKIQKGETDKFMERILHIE